MEGVSAAWLAELLDRDDVSSVACEDMSGTGGLNCPMTRLLVTYKDGGKAGLVHKRHDADKRDMNKQLGLAREALFYKAFSSNETLGSILPKVWHAEGDMSTGEKTIIMQDLGDAIQSGYFFGPVSPHNWDKDLLQKTRGLSAKISALDVAKVAARAAAEVHASFFRDIELAKDGFSWLRGSRWISGEGQALWEAYQGQSRAAWESLDFANSGVAWDPFLRECIDAAIGRAKTENGGFSSFLAWMEKAPWSLVHGDFHPANCMLLAPPDPEGGLQKLRLILLDWENVGVGSGPQEIAQFLISHMDPGLRATVESEVLQEYYRSLISRNPQIAEVMSYDECWREYVAGGAGKWTWFMPLLATGCPPKMTQYFHDQLLAFLKTHMLTPETMPMPRS